jgi:hypothetical protein
VDVVDGWLVFLELVGDHFAAPEEPGTLVEDVREFFCPQR